MNNPNIAIIGDTHACPEELRALLDILRAERVGRIISVGDLTDKGPDSNQTLEIASDYGVELCNSNHDEKYIRFIKKHRKPETIENLERRKVYESLSTKSKNYLLTARPFIDISSMDMVVVHGGIGPHNNLDEMDGKTFNEILRLRYVDQHTLEHVSTIHRSDGSYAPEHPNVYTWQEVYDGRYGTVVYGHDVGDLDCTRWTIDVQGRPFTELVPANEVRDLSIMPDTMSVRAIGIDTGLVYGGHLTALVIDLINDGIVYFKQVKAKKIYTT